VPRLETYPSLFLSIIEGMMEWMYVDVQMQRRMTRTRDWRLNIAVWEGVRWNSGGERVAVPF
jgi:hypothetical protein